MRYGPESKDYFWINDMQPRLIMHPYRTDLEGKDIAGFTDPSGKHLFVEVVRTVKNSGAGYVDYQWQWKDDPDRIVPKISYVKGFDPWGWIIGTGIYVEDVHTEIAAITRPRGIILVCDGAQVPGMLQVDVKALGVDAYASSSHKWMLAPKGSGLPVRPGDDRPAEHRRSVPSVRDQFGLPQHPEVPRHRGLGQSHDLDDLRHAKFMQTEYLQERSTRGVRHGLKYEVANHLPSPHYIRQSG